ncbi:MAG: GNAT family N-acetyltransferase [Clostridia bacterium]|nr:GNAT family N-acetyltransferase [Clostridia bacterium]
MNIKLCKNTEIDKIMSIYDNARNFMRQTGNNNQWINGYPSRELILEDLKENRFYGVYDNEELVAVFTLTVDSDPTYNKIYNGNWLNDEPYAVIHRIGVLKRGKGIAKLCFDYALTKCNNLRIDTSEENLVMQNCLLKNGFSYCGVIYLESGAPRLAYQKKI